MQSDGNLVLRAPGNMPLGDTDTAGRDGAIAVMQTDGNFVLRAPGNIPIWASGTDGHPGTVLQVQDDGGVVLYAPGHQVLRVLFPASTGPHALRRPGTPPPPASPAPTGPVTPTVPLQYVALGDSYSSGEGEGQFLPGSDTADRHLPSIHAGVLAVRHAETGRVRCLLRAGHLSTVRTRDVGTGAAPAFAAGPPEHEARHTHIWRQ